MRPIGTSARVGGTSGVDVEAMEGFAVLRAAELAGVPAVEARVISNEIDEPDRTRWRLDDALATLAELLPRLVAGSGVSTKPLPPPLPPETRTIGQLVAEAVRLYGRHFWPALARRPARGLGPVAFGGSVAERIVVLLAFAPVFTAAYAWAAAMSGRRPGRARWVTTIVVGSLVFAPAAIFFPWFTLLSVAWLALVGLVVPVLVIEDVPARRALRRAFELGRADYVHALGSLATLMIVFVLTRFALAFVLRLAGGQHDPRLGDHRGRHHLAAHLPRRRAALRRPGGRVLGTIGLPRAASDPTTKEATMPTYLMLTTLTPQGVQTLKANPGRLREVNRDVEELGAKVLHQWATLGEYDFVNIVEAPDAATIAKVSLALGARGSAKLQSLELVEIDSLLGALEA